MMIQNFSLIISYVLFSISILGSLVFVILVWSNAHNLRTSILFTIFNVFLDIWLLTLFIYYDTHSYYILNLVGKLNFSSVVLVVLALYLFIQYFPDNSIKVNKYMNYMVYLGTALIIYLIHFTSLISVNEVFTNDTKETVFGPLYPIFVIYFVLFIFVGVVILIKKYGNSRGNKRLQIAYLILGVISSAVVGLTTNIILPYVFNYFYLQSFGPIATTILISALSYSIIKHRFLDIRIVVSSVIYVFILSTLLILTIYGSYLLEIALFRTILTVFVVSINILVSIFIVTSGIVLSRFLKKFLQDSIVNYSYDRLEVMDIFLDRTSNLVNMDDIMQETLDVLNSIFDLTSCFIVVEYEDEKKVYELGNGMTKVEFLKELNNVSTGCLKGIHLYDEIKDEVTTEFMEKFDLEIIVNNENSLIFLGSRKNKSAYTVNDISLLGNIASSLKSSINRSILHQEVIDFNELLKKEVRKATNELRDKNKAIQNAYDNLTETARQERDMLDIMGHELRTPATVVKMASYLINNDILDAFSKKQVERIKDSIERQIRLINTFINTAKIDNDRMDAVFNEVHLEKLAEESVEDNLIDAQHKELKLEYIDGHELPPIIADKAMMREVIDNLISNAIKYTVSGGIKVRCFLSKNKKEIIVSISDTGEGIKSVDNELIFQKFKRLNNYTSKSTSKDQPKIIRPGGTGLGLYVCKKIIELHNGRIWVESEIGKGSTFSFAIKVN